MAKKDRVWEFLGFGSEDGSDYELENDGGWGYENSDGSGSYYGVDSGDED